MGRKDLRRIDAHWHSNGAETFRAVSASGTAIACEFDENELRQWLRPYERAPLLVLGAQAWGDRVVR